MIIGISGKLGSGKDSLAELILKHSQRIIAIKKFADKLKEICAILSGRPIDDKYSIEGKNIFISEFNITMGVMH